MIARSVAEPAAEDGLITETTYSAVAAPAAMPSSKPPRVIVYGVAATAAGLRVNIIAPLVMVIRLPEPRPVSLTS
jgi:hypothetical protein